MTTDESSTVRVQLDVLVAPEQEDRLAEAIRSSVGSVAPEPGWTTSDPAWAEASGGEDLVRQWEIEQDSPLGDRRVRQVTMDVHGVGVADLVGEISSAAIEAVCPGASEEHRRIDAGEQFPAVPDEFPWSSDTQVVPGAKPEGV